MCVCGYMCVGAHVEVRRQPIEVVSLLSSCASQFGRLGGFYLQSHLAQTHFLSTLCFLTADPMWPAASCTRCRDSSTTRDCISYQTMSHGKLFFLSREFSAGVWSQQNRKVTGVTAVRQSTVFFTR